MAGTTSREIRLTSRPHGIPGPENFEIAEVALPDPGPGQMLIRNVVMSVDPYMRGRMTDRESYVPPFRIGAALDGGAIGEVMVTNGGPFPVGTYVSHMQGWRDYALSSGAGVIPVDGGLAPLSAFLGTLGMPGLTAYAGLLRIAELKEGDVVFVSAAAGAVGTVVCQIAKIKGCRVIGSAGSDAKVEWLRNEAGCDTAFNYKHEPNLLKAILAGAPEGIDIYFENVGGSHLTAALHALRPKGRIAVCGMIDQYNATSPQPGPDNLVLVIPKRLTIRGFIVTDHADLMPQFLRDMAQWVGSGQIKWRETVIEGLDRAPEAFLGLFKGENMGKMIVRLGPDRL